VKVPIEGSEIVNKIDKIPMQISNSISENPCC